MPVPRSRWDRPASPPSDSPSGTAPAPPRAADARTEPVPSSVRRTTRTRVGAAWVGIAIAALLLVLLIVFMLQNTAPVDVTFLGMTGTAPLALTLLIAGVGVGLVALAVGSVRIGQLRHRIGADRRAAAPRP